MDMDEVVTLSPPSQPGEAPGTVTEGTTMSVHEAPSGPPADTSEEEAAQDWQTQTYQVFGCMFDPSESNRNFGVVKSYTTGDAFNATVGEARLQMGIKDDQRKMTNGRENNFFKALKWSPDGTCLLSSSNDHCLRIFALPDATISTPEDTQLSTGVLIKEGEVVYDMCWYPAMTSLDPATCCVLSSSRDHPVHLWDAYTGELRCSYTIVDHCEVNVAPNALCFNLDGSKIYCGSNNMIQIFDTTRPGRDSFKRPTVPTRKSRKGQKGVISCMAFNPDHSDLYAAGSYLRTIGLYDARAEEMMLLLRDKPSQPRSRKRSKNTAMDIDCDNHTDPRLDKSLQTQTSLPMGGVTQVQFSPDGLYLYSASRQDPFIRCWDIRNTANVLHRLERPGELTNQRISFDISCDGRWLTTGDMNGDVSIFDLLNPEFLGGDVDSEGGGEEKVERLAARFKVHDDVVSTAAFHPSGAMLATSSGQRKYDLQFHDLDSSDSEDSDSGLENNDVDKQAAEKETNRSSTSKNTAVDALGDGNALIDNSVRLWSLPGDYLWYVNGQRWIDPASLAVDETKTSTHEGVSVETTEVSSSSTHPDPEMTMDDPIAHCEAAVEDSRTMNSSSDGDSMVGIVVTEEVLGILK